MLLFKQHKIKLAQPFDLANKMKKIVWQTKYLQEMNENDEEKETRRLDGSWKKVKNIAIKSK